MNAFTGKQGVAYVIDLCEIKAIAALNPWHIVVRIDETSDKFQCMHMNDSPAVRKIVLNYLVVNSSSHFISYSLLFMPTADRNI